MTVRRGLEDVLVLRATVHALFGVVPLLIQWGLQTRPVPEGFDAPSNRDCASAKTRYLHGSTRLLARRAYRIGRTQKRIRSRKGRQLYRTWPRPISTAARRPCLLGQVLPRVLRASIRSPRNTRSIHASNL